MSDSKWSYEQHELCDGFRIVVYDENDYMVADGVSDDQANLICSAVSACKTINPENPQAAADAIADVVKTAQRFLSAPEGSIRQGDARVELEDALRDATEHEDSQS